MQRKVFAALLVLAAAGYFVFYYGIKKKTDQEETPRQEAMKMGRQTDGFTQSVTQALQAYYQLAKAMEQKNEAAYRRSLDSFETKLKAITIRTLKAEPSLTDFVEGLHQTLLTEVAALQNKEPVTAASGFQSLSDYLFDFLRTTKYSGESVYQLRNQGDDALGGYNWLSNYPGGNSPYSGKSAGLQLVDSLTPFSDE
jgi:hypothetical protein